MFHKLLSSLSGNFLWRTTCILPPEILCPSGGYLCIAPEERQNRCAGKAKGDVIESSGVVLSEQELGCAEQLSLFFPGATPVCCAVEVTLLRAGSTQLRESTLLEFASPGVAIFLSALPLEFDDRVRLGRDRIGSPADAIVIAVQYHEGRKAVAVRFTQGLCEWVTQPR